MDLEFTDEQEELRATVRGVLAKECTPALVREVVENGVGAERLWSRMVDLDWPALTVGEDEGGLGFGFVELAVVLEELGRAIAPGPFAATLSQFAPAVREAGTAGQRSRFLGPVAAGTATGALAVAEEAGEWSTASIRAVAERRDGSWHLSGTKWYVADATTADEIVVAARRAGSEGDEGISLFVVPGAGVGPAAQDTLDPTLHLARLDLDGIVVAGDRVLGTPEAAAAPLRRALEEATTAAAMMAVGTCAAILNMTIAYAKDREQFGVPIGAFQAVKHKLVDMYVAVERARALAYFAALTIAEDDDRRPLAVSMAKAAAGECQRLVVQDGLQLHGGIGYTWEHDLHLYLKRAKAVEGQFGTAAWHRLRVSDLISP